MVVINGVISVRIGSVCDLGFKILFTVVNNMIIIFFL